MATAKAIRQEHLLDEEITEFGIRFLELDPFHGLRINGETVKLRGACIHHDNGVIGAATIQRAEERRVSILKEAGFNAIRSAHHPAGKALLSACDRLGMLVMDETFDMWTEQKNPYDYGLHFPVWWEQDVEQMVKKDYNETSPLKVFEHVYGVILDRKLHPKEGSYTNYLFDKGIDKILKKVGEEATELVIAAKNPDPEEIKYELSDLLYHAMVLMAERGVTWEDVTEELANR